MDETIEILTGLKGLYEKHHGVSIIDDGVKAAVNLSARYINDRFLPDKAIDLMDEAAAKVRLRVGGRPEEIVELRHRINMLEEEMLEKINRLGIGPGGLGGTTTALAVNINTYPTHIAGLPVAVNICCHVNRHIVREL